jgi:hypothetical protein
MPASLFAAVLWPGAPGDDYGTLGQVLPVFSLRFSRKRGTTDT